VLRGLEVLTGIQVFVDVLGRHGHLGSMFSVWVVAWGNRLVVRYLASRDVHEFVPSPRPRSQGGIARAARQGQRGIIGLPSLVTACCGWVGWLS
jgi:hypothetical protein